SNPCSVHDASLVELRSAAAQRPATKSATDTSKLHPSAGAHYHRAPRPRLPVHRRSIMFYLIAVTLLSAISFSLIGEYLAGQVDSSFAVLPRILLLRPRRLPRHMAGGLLLVGALQFGITYICLYLSFELLSVPEVLLFTIFTPLYVALIDNALRRRFSIGPVVATLLAVLGAAIIRYDGISEAYIKGFLLLQLANLAFAAGQVGYAHLIRRSDATVSQQWAGFG